MRRDDCAFLLLTESCNLSCRHCYVSASPFAGPHMPIETATAALRLFASIGIDDVRLTGGEPTIHPDLPQIMDEAGALGIRVGIVSNGIRLLGTAGGRALLGRFHRCWISLYGIDAQRHTDMGGRGVRPLAQLIAAVGQRAQEGYLIGLSALVRPGDLEFVDQFIADVAAAGVERLRFLPLQPDGRAADDSSIPWRDWPQEVLLIARHIKAHPDAARFEKLTINDPFDLGNRANGCSSCLLMTRQMWSVTPDGAVYPCCFTVYRAEMRVGHVAEPDIACRLRAAASTGTAGTSCHGLALNFWRGAPTASINCPISAIDPRQASFRAYA